MNAMPKLNNSKLSTVEAEQQLIGAVFINNDAFHLVSSIVNANHFSDQLYANIWQLIVDQIAAGREANPVTLKPFVENVSIGDLPAYNYLVRLMMECAGVVHAKSYALVIVDMAARRRLVQLSDDIKDKAFHASPDYTANQILIDLENAIDNLQDDVAPETDDGTATNAVDKIFQVYQSNKVAPTIPAPLNEMREVLSGDFEAGNLYGLLSASGEGKTSLALQVIDHAAASGHPVYFLSYDQTETQCIMQIATQRVGIEGKRLRDKTLTKAEEDRFFKELMDIRKLPIKVKNCTNENINQIASYVRRFLKWNRSDKTPLIVLDHVRKVQPLVAGTYEGRIASEIGGTSKALAKEHNVVWLNIMQRKSIREGRENPHPTDQDLFGGEQAKEDYDGIMYLYRPEKYREMRMTKANSEKKRDEIAQYLSKWSGKSKLGSLKVRFGDPSIWRPLEFQAEYTRYLSARKDEQEVLEGFL